MSVDKDPMDDDSSVQSANHAPYEYKRRKRVYEKMKTNCKYKSLATVPEGQVLKEAPHTWLGPKIVGLLFALIVTFAGLKECVRAIGILAHGNVGNDEPEGGDLLRRRKGSSYDEREGGEEEEEDQDAADQIPDIDLVPSELEFLADTNEPLRINDRAFFWHVPRSGGATVKQIAAQCFGLLMATEAGGAQASDEIKIITDIDGGKFVNVDTATPQGIDHAQKVNLANLAGLHFVSTPFLYEASQKLFGELTRGRMFAMLRHPIERATSLYYLLASDPTNGVLIPGESLEDFAKSDRVEKNWMTRFLSNGVEESMTMDNLVIAKKVLKQKCLVGLLKYKGESLWRFENYFGWKMDGEKMEECHTKMLDWNWPNKNKHIKVREGTETWRLLLKNNELDIKLYKYAEELFEEQGRTLFQK